MAPVTEAIRGAKAARANSKLFRIRFTTNLLARRSRTRTRRTGAESRGQLGIRYYNPPTHGQVSGHFGDEASGPPTGERSASIWRAVGVSSLRFLAHPNPYPPPSSRKNLARRKHPVNQGSVSHYQSVASWHETSPIG